MKRFLPLLLLPLIFTGCLKNKDDKKDKGNIYMTVDGKPLNLSNNIIAQLGTFDQRITVLDIFGFDDADPAARIHLVIASTAPIKVGEYIRHPNVQDPSPSMDYSPDGNYFQPMISPLNSPNPLRLIITAITIDHIEGTFSGDVEKDGLVTTITDGRFSVALN
ncbi:MAG: hypothetical protein EOO09_13310 [Chitinophagaceae bacterium]|nr:MAG: hypothetical protein EOO09_13310 [Chitinophagaceae bacterium]